MTVWVCVCTHARAFLRGARVRVRVSVRVSVHEHATHIEVVQCEQRCADRVGYVRVDDGRLVVALQRKVEALRRVCACVSV